MLLPECSNQEYIVLTLNLSSSGTNHYRVKKIGIIMSNHYVYEIVIFFFFAWVNITILCSELIMSFEIVKQYIDT
jgi:hypothetical protein